MGLSVVDFDF